MHRNAKHISLLLSFHWDSLTPFLHCDLVAEVIMALLWAQALLLVTMAMTDGVQGTVEKELLYMETPSVGLEDHSLQKICQLYNNKPHLLADNVPIYSAYTFKCSDWEKRVDMPWMYEPQLFTVSDTGEMQASRMATCTGTLRMTRPCWKTTPMPNFTNHLNPDDHQADPDDKAST